MPDIVALIQYQNRLEFNNMQLREKNNTLKLIYEKKQSEIDLAQDNIEMLEKKIRELENENVTLRMGRRN